MFKDKKSFTLIELLVVISIFGLLASVIIASTGAARVRARDARRLADLNSVQKALELYHSKYGRYPADLNDLATTSNAFLLKLPGNVAGPVPACTANLNLFNNYICYAAFGGSSCNSYHIGVRLEDPSNTALKTDADTWLSGSPSMCQGPIGVPTGDFNGATVDCANSASSSPSQCFDLRS